jgi:hypothetical protein
MIIVLPYIYIYIYIYLYRYAIIVLYKSHFFRGQNGENGGIAGPLRGEGQWWFGGHLDSDRMNPKPWKYVSKAVKI